MSSPFLGLRTVIYRVAEMTKAKEWYSLVFNTQPYFDEPFYIGFNIGGYELGLQPAPADEETLAQGGVETYWGVPDIDEAYNKLINHGAIPYDPPRDVGGDIMVAMVKDPWGNILGIIYNPHFKVE
ncbi:VOC family protein [Chitinophaga sedimenti]|uniref:VOC family protein n=1 Tax=Chitinophaga sedimenti TaxID=2033606 RepID=UPI0020056213|nr:VOC family protein [Chitinophaga sedimenti]MCK7559826.1 VOC family protein [Chitinophaga sedimenti]